MQPFDVVIVGGGHAGAQAAIALRQQGYAGSIAIIGEEAGYPYERPPLSKEYLLGEKSFERMLIRPPAFWEERGIELISGAAVTRLDPEAKAVTTNVGAIIGYGKLVWAAGGRARRLTCPGHDLKGVHVVRTREDIDHILDELGAVRSVAVVGGGYIGLEAAAGLTRLGKEVVLLEALDRVLARVAAEPLSRFYEAEHRARGVDVRTGVAVTCIEQRDGRASGVRLADGEVVAADMVIVGIGISPSIEPLAAAGAECGDGVAVDASCRTTLPDVYAVGDCALHRNRFAAGAWVRIESVQNASDQANVVAAAIRGQEAEYSALPWFWSNQFDLKLRTVGLSADHDATVMRGDPTSRRFSLAYLKQGHLVALDCVNSVKDYVQGRKLIAQGATPDPARLADASIPLKDIAAS